MTRKYEDESGFETGEYWARKSRDTEERIAAGKAYAATPAGQLEALRRKADAMRAAHIDSGMYSPEEIEAVEQQITALKAANVAQAPAQSDPTRQTQLQVQADGTVLLVSAKGTMSLRWNGTQLVEFGRNGKALPLAAAKVAEVVAALPTAGAVVWIGKQDLA